MSKERITEEIKDLAPQLAVIKRTNCYRVPEQYFENLSLKADQIKREAQGYQVPEQYFENMQTEVLSRINSGTKKTKKKVTIYRKIMPWTIGVAASLLLVVSLPFLTDTNGTDPIVAEDLTDLDYLSENIDEFELDELLDLDESQSSAIDLLETDILEDYIENNLEEFELDDFESLL